MPADAAPPTAYRVKADSVEACNCKHGCNCQFAGFPNEGKCEFIIGYAVKDGRFGNLSLDGVRAVVAARYPNAIHEGNGHVVLFIDEKATTIERFDGPIRKPVEIHVNGERSTVRVQDAIDLSLMPLKDPITGEDKQVHIVYPKGGFFWNDAAVATTKTMRASHGDLHLEWPGRYASAAEVNWTNQR
jgi:hypothetical protein